MTLVLASSSPRRSELLNSLDVAFEVLPANINEATITGEGPVAYVRRLSLGKALAVQKLVAASRIVLAADSTVDVDGDILGKPVDAAEARSMLWRMSNRWHRVHTAVTVAQGSRAETICVSTRVEFRELSADEVEWYVETGEPFDKAGGYGLQGRAAGFICAVDGSPTNVVGLPLAQSVMLLRSFGIAVAQRQATF